MTEQQAWQIVGRPPGWYEGVGGIRTDAPFFKGYQPSWVGLRGEIVVDLDESGHVAHATFYSGEVLAWTATGYLWERFTRVKYLGLSLPSRFFLFLILSAMGTFTLGMAGIPSGSENATARHGLIGLLIGSIVAVSMFSDSFISDLLETACTLSGPIFGAFVGVFVGFGRSLLVKRHATTSIQKEAMTIARVL